MDEKIIYSKLIDSEKAEPYVRYLLDYILAEAKKDGLGRSVTHTFVNWSLRNWEITIQTTSGWRFLSEQKNVLLFKVYNGDITSVTVYDKRYETILSRAMAYYYTEFPHLKRCEFNKGFYEENPEALKLLQPIQINYEQLLNLPLGQLYKLGLQDTEMTLHS